MGTGTDDGKKYLHEKGTNGGSTLQSIQGAGNNGGQKYGKGRHYKNPATFPTHQPSQPETQGTQSQSQGKTHGCAQQIGHGGS